MMPGPCSRGCQFWGPVFATRLPEQASGFSYTMQCPECHKRFWSGHAQVQVSSRVLQQEVLVLGGGRGVD